MHHNNLIELTLDRRKMNRHWPTLRRSTRLAAFASDTADERSRRSSQANDGSVVIGKFQLIFDDKPMEVVEGPTDTLPLMEPLISYSSWRFMGCTHQEAVGMAALEANLKRSVVDLQMKQRRTRDHGIAYTITPMKNAMSANDLEFVLPHDDLLLPHWISFSMALKGLTCDYHTMYVGFASIKLNPSVLNILSPALKAQNLTSLYFLNNHLRRDEIMMISDIIGQIPTLEAFAISRNRIGDQKEDVRAKLSTAIRKHPSIQRLTLSSCGIGDDKVMLSCIRNRTLTKIDLGSNAISSVGAYYIAKFLANADSNHRVLERGKE